MHRAETHKAKQVRGLGKQCVAARGIAVHGIVLGCWPLAGAEAAEGRSLKITHSKVDTAVYVFCAVQLRRRQT
jgi:hypothetical protein